MIRAHVLALGLALAVLACGKADETDPQPEPQADAAVSTAPDAGQPIADAPPTVSIDLANWAKVQGTVAIAVNAQDDLGVAKVELFVNESTTPAMTKTAAPFDLAWDTTLVPNGAATILVRATDTTGHYADSMMTRALVINGGTEATYLDGNQWEVRIPGTYPNYTGELDAKNHWNMPAGITKVIATLEWEVPQGQRAWKLAFAGGRGECPDSGAIIGAESDPSFLSPIVITMEPTGGFTTGLHFVHIRPADPLDHVGQTLPYTVHVYLF